MARVSVIVPVYNTERDLPRCLDALVGQTLQDLEIIAVNDGSKDGSLAILEDYQSRYPGKLKVYSQENQGQAVARNFGITQASGDYIGFADSDDYVDIHMFEKMLSLAEKEEADYVECLFYYLQEEEGKTRQLKPRGRVRDYGSSKQMLIDPQVSPWNKLYKREILLAEGRSFPEGLIYEDTAFFAKTVPGIHKACCLQEPMVYYFLRGNSTMNANRSKRVGDFFGVLDNILDYYRTQGYEQEYQEELTYFASKLLLCSHLSRVGRVRDKELRRELLNKTFAYLEKNFPDYRNNSYFEGKIKCYISMVKPWNAGFFARILGRVMKG